MSSRLDQAGICPNTVAPKAIQKCQESLRVGYRTGGAGSEAGARFSQSRLAELAGVSRQSVVGLETGHGRVSTLAATLEHIDLKIAGLGSGDSLGDQLRKARTRKMLSKEELARRTGLSVPTLRDLEAGGGSVPSLARAIEVLAPAARPRKVRQAHWQRRGDDRFTPPEYLDAVVSAFGPISVDPCANPRSFVQAGRYIYPEEDGLLSDWTGHLSYVNPPFSDHSRWIKRCAQAIERAEIEVVVALLAARIETMTFHKLVLGRADIVVPRGKPRFFDQAGARMSIAPFAVLFAIWSADRSEVLAFARALRGAVIWADAVTPS